MSYLADLTSFWSRIEFRAPDALGQATAWINQLLGAYPSQYLRTGENIKPLTTDEVAPVFEFVKEFFAREPDSVSESENTRVLQLRKQVFKYGYDLARSFGSKNLQVVYRCMLGEAVKLARISGMATALSINLHESVSVKDSYAGSAADFDSARLCEIDKNGTLDRATESVIQFAAFLGLDDEKIESVYKVFVSESVSAMIKTIETIVMPKAVLSAGYRDKLLSDWRNVHQGFDAMDVVSKCLL